MKQKQTPRHREQTVVEKGEAAGGVVEWEVGGSEGGKMKHKMTIRNLKIICPDMLANLN